MGAAESRSVFGEHEDLLRQLVSSKPIPANAIFWEDLLAFSHPLPKLKPADVDSATREACVSLLENTAESGQLAKLCLHLSRTLSALPPSLTRLPLQAISATHFTRLFLKHMVESYSTHDIAPLLALTLSDEEAAALHLPPGPLDVVQALTRSLLAFVATQDVNPASHLLHLEVLNLLLVMLSTQLHAAIGASSADPHIFLDCIMLQEELAVPFVQKALSAYIERQPLPPRSPLYAPGQMGGEGGVLRKVGSAAAAVFLLPYYTYSYLVTSLSRTGGKSPLGDTSLLVLLLLVHYGKVKGGEGGEVGAVGGDGRPEYQLNPFRNAVANARDAQLGSGDEGGEAHAHVPFAALFDTLSACVVDDRSTLLLYSLVHSNSAFLEYLLVRADLDTILMPLLEMLYRASDRTPNQIYILLIILLLLTQDASFNANVHKLILPGVPWYKERLLPRISLGSLMVVILIRTVKYNLSKLRDVYLHTNCLATLANMAPHVHHINAYASQRLISLFHMLARKYTKLSEGSLSRKQLEGGGKGVGEEGGEDDVPTELHIYTDFLRIVLEIINAILSYALPRNPEVVYALLHRQELFAPFRHHQRFYELVENIWQVIDFFNVRMEEMFTELRFTYEEELHPEEFFVPYVWTLVVAHGGIPWNRDAITLFSLNPTTQVDEVTDDGLDTSSEYTPTPREEV